jgi:hypothetical protein
MMTGWLINMEELVEYRSIGKIKEITWNKTAPVTLSSSYVPGIQPEINSGYNNGKLVTKNLNQGMAL